MSSVKASGSRKIRKSKSNCSNNSDLEDCFLEDFSANKNYNVIVGPGLKKKRKSQPPRSPSPIFGQMNSSKKLSRKMLTSYNDTCKYLQNQVKDLKN
jgi:hypothetical protein